LIDEDLGAGVTFDVLKEQGGAAGRRSLASITFASHLGDPVGDFSDFEDGINLGAYFFQFASAVQRGNPIT
jgi:hypothetical protein